MPKAAKRSGKMRPFVYLCRNVCSSPLPFVLVGLFIFLLFNCSFYILDTNPLLDICFAVIFSLSVSCRFTLWIESFDIQMFLIWMKSNVCIFSFVAKFPYLFKSDSNTTWFIGLL